MTLKNCELLNTSQAAHQVGAYPSFHSIKRLEILIFHS